MQTHKDIQLKNSGVKGSMSYNLFIDVKAQAAKNETHSGAISILLTDDVWADFSREHAAMCTDCAAMLLH